MPPEDARGPIVSTDRVSDVLARDEGLVEVFVRHSSAFEKLRSRTMRRVMARLVTVEHAARMAGVPVRVLLRDLNEAVRSSEGTTTPAGGDDASSAAPGAPAPRGPGSQGTHPAGAEVVELDVREELRAGREPFSKIMAVVGSLRDDQVLHLRAIFEPVPLLALLSKRGLAHEVRQRSSDDWSVWFWRADGEAARPSATPTAQEREASDASTVWLDVRGLQPPEPLMRTLAALETLGDEQELVQVNARVPQLLLPMLAERGYACEVDESRADRVLVRIWRPPRH